MKKRKITVKTTSRKVQSKKKKKKPKLPRSRKPDGMDLEQWQVGLRRQFGREQEFRVKNIGSEPIFSEYLVSNSQTKSQYRIAIRGTKAGQNYCSCPDYAVNTLGTCKHIEYVLFKLARKRGGKKALAAGYSHPNSEVYLRYGIQREVIFSAGTKSPKAIRELAKRYFSRDGVLKQPAYSQFHTFLKNAEKIDPDLRCYEDALGFIAEVRDLENLPKQIARSFGRSISKSAFRKIVRASLYPYQCQGAMFAAQAGRCLIADDMGLGKTIQAIAAVEILAQTVGLDKILIVSPTSLKHQWKQEIEKFSDRQAEVVEGSLSRRAASYQANTSFYKITNYDVIHRDLDAIHNWAPDLIILDEAQRIKNWQTRTARSVKKLDSKYAFVLTGTPLENRLEELHSIVEFIDRHHLGPRFRFLAKHQHVDEDGRVVGYRNLSQIAKTLETILIRRNKKEVLKELPERLEKNYFVPMTTQQQKHHEENQETVARIVAKWRRFKYLSDTDKRILMIALQNMRMSCNSTYLLDRKTDYGVKADELLTVLTEIFEEPQVKAVVFSQWLGTHELITERLKSQKLNHILFHGGVPSRKRKDLVKQFKEDPDCRVFLSTDAGGVGLNLQNASAVVNMDLPWNPAVLDQRIGRVHRLGQHRPVRVINFVAQGTIEHSMLSILSFKQSLFAGVLEKGQDEVFLGGSRLKRFMESVETVTTRPAAPMSAPTETDESGVTETPAASTKGKTRKATASDSADWEKLLSAGIGMLGKLSQALAGGKTSKSSPLAKMVSGLAVEKDPTTGQQQLKVPMPPKETLQTIAKFIDEFVKTL